MDYYNNNNNNNMDYHNAGYYQNNGRSGNQGGDVDVVGPYSKNGYNNNSYPQYSENHLGHANNNYHPQYVNNNLPANYNNNNNYDGGGVYSDLRNGYNNIDPYYSNVKSTSPGGSAYGNDSGYSDPHNLSSRSNLRYNNQNLHTSPFNNTNPSYNTPYPPSPIKNPSSPNMPGINPTYPPINPIPARQVPYDGRTTSPYSEDASKEMYSSSMPSSNSGPTNHGQENPISPSSAYSKKPFLNDDDDDYDEKKYAKPGGLMKYCCCGGRPTCCKICAITCCILILLIIGIVAAVLLWARPPQVDFLGVAPSPNGLPPYNANPTGFDFNFGLRIQVDNPNIVGANFQMIQAIAFYPGHSDPIGGGNLTNVAIAAKANTTIDFPFSVNYNKDIDPGFAILLDIAQKCGLTGNPKQKLEIDYKLTVTLRVLLINVSPSFDKKAMIDCPIQDGKIPNIPGFDISKVANSFGKKKKRDLEIQKSPMALSK